MSNIKTNSLQNSNRSKTFQLVTEYNVPSNPEKYAYIIPFKVCGHLALIQELIKRGVFVKIDPTFKYACVLFDNTIDFNYFKTYI